MYAEELCFAPKYVRIKQLLDQGALGAPVLIKQSEKHDGPHAPHFWNVEQSGGGVTMDMGCHAIEFFRWMLGRPKIKSIYAQMGTYFHKDKTKGDDNAIIILEFENDVMAMAEESWTKLGGMDDKAEVHGTKGVEMQKMVYLFPLLAGFCVCLQGTMNGYWQSRIGLHITILINGVIVAALTALFFLIANQTPIDRIVSEIRPWITLNGLCGFVILTIAALTFPIIGAASVIVPGMGQFMNDDPGMGALFTSLGVVTGVGGLLGAYFLLPGELQFDELDYFDDSFATIEDAWKAQSFVDLLPSIGVLVGTGVVQVIIRSVSGDHAAKLAEQRIAAGEITFEPKLTILPGGPGTMGFGMGMKY